MKRNIAGGLVLSSLFVAQLAFAQDDEDAASREDKKGESESEEKEPASVSVLIEPLLAIFGFYEGEVDVTADDNIAIGLWGQYFDYTVFDTGVSGFGVGVGTPLFVTGTVYNGMYIHPLFKFQQVKFMAGGEEASVTYYGPLVTVGHQWTFGKAFSLKLGGGLEYSFGDFSSDVIDQSASFNGLDYELDASIGVAF